MQAESVALMKVWFNKKSSKPESNFRYDIKFDDFKELPNGALIFPIVNDNDPDFAEVVGYGTIPSTPNNLVSVIGYFSKFNAEEEEYLEQQLQAFRLAIF